MITGDYDVVVIGLGAMGSAALFHLARRGCRVCGIEQFAIAHDRGSSGGDTRIIRQAYPEKSEYAPLLARSYRLWEELAAESGEEILHLCGFLAIGPEGSGYLQRIGAYFREHPLPHARWNRADIRHHFPQFRVPDHYAAYFDPQGGILHVARAIRAHVMAAKTRGAEILTGETVVSRERRGNAIVVVTNRRKLRTGRLIITSGAWMVPEMERLGVRLEIWRRVNLWFPAVRPERFSPQRFPAFVVDCAPLGFYGCPAIRAEGVKIGEHNRPLPIATPAEKDLPLQKEETAVLHNFSHKFLPDLSPRPVRSATCLYTVTADHHPIIGSHPASPRVIIAGGFSGHGFKLAPVIGEILADLATKGTTHHPIGFLNIDRFLQ